MGGRGRNQRERSRYLDKAVEKEDGRELKGRKKERGESLLSCPGMCCETAKMAAKPVRDPLKLAAFHGN